ncbi:transcriptional antiterminator [Zophobihabitans entericus]|uniref:Transcriptional antiterminator n=1 Tax=Zophobihabitans entericus TaxID=1635327 RepID=A0A6G9I9H5_9GAMM|nr:transcriptional antiterminator [Zophobihabitans entericus]QIQ20871.1 transcriptional antiterminator [Zophobihabitans entericus]
MSQAKFKMIADDLNPEVVTDQTIEIINEWFKEAGVTQNEVQKAMLLSHVKAMVSRAKTLEKLPEVDPEMFDELSEESMALARKTVELFDTLPVEEAYLLAVHYEVARANEE